MSKMLCILCILFNLWAAPIICWYFRELERVARSMQPVCRQRRSKLQKSLKYLSSYIINDNLYSYLSCISYIINDKLSYSKSRNYATPPDENDNHSYIFVFPDLCLHKQTNLSAQLFILAQHVSTIRPWSRAAFYWTEFTFTSHEVKVNFVSKLDINQKSESKDPHWQSISSELFEKTQPLRGLFSHF